VKRDLLFIVLVSGLSWTALAQASPGSTKGAAMDPVTSYLQPLVDNHTLAGAVVLVADRNGIVYNQGVGFRDIAAQSPMASDDMFWIASTTKPMTATALMMLVDEGKVSVDDPVEKYLPEFKGQMVLAVRPDASAKPAPGAEKPAVVPASHPILIREILSHTSGLRFKSAAQPGALDLLPLADAVRSFAAEPLLFQPGTGYSYSNEGLNTAARIIEVVTGMSYERFMQERLFFPLGMKDTTFWPTPEQQRRIATSYAASPETKTLKAQPIEQLTYPLDDRVRRYAMPAGGLFSTAQDVSTFCRMILNGGVLNGRRYISAASLHAMTSTQNGGMGGSDYGFGWGISKTGFGHGGAYNNAMEIDTASGRILIFMAQQAGAWGTDAGKAMVPELEKLADAMVSDRKGAD
jgi:CubicO group peptidase (beta-lactamase class C family)